MRRECRQWGHKTSPCYTSTRPGQMGLAPFRCLNHRSRVASRRRRTDDALVFRAFAEPVHKCTAHPRNQSYAVPLSCIATPFPHAMLPRTSIPLALQRPQPCLGNARHPRPCIDDNLANNLSRSPSLMHKRTGQLESSDHRAPLLALSSTARSTQCQSISTQRQMPRACA